MNAPVQICYMFFEMEKNFEMSLSQKYKKNKTFESHPYFKKKWNRKTQIYFWEKKMFFWVLAVNKFTTLKQSVWIGRDPHLMYNKINLIWIKNRSITCGKILAIKEKYFFKASLYKQPKYEKLWNSPTFWGLFCSISDAGPVTTFLIPNFFRLLTLN